MDVITPQDILIPERDKAGRLTGRWFHKNRELTKPEIDNLKAEAELISRTQLWKFLINEGKYHAQRRAIMDAKNGEDLKLIQEFHKMVVLFEEFVSNFK